MAANRNCRHFYGKTSEPLMTSLAQALCEKTGLPLVDGPNLEPLLREPAPLLLFFPGDPAQRPESHDVAIVFPELLKAFDGRLRGAVVASVVEKSLGEKFGVDVFPSLALIRESATVGVIPRIRDWREYCEKIEAFLLPGAAPAAKAGPRVDITYSKKGGRA